MRERFPAAGKPLEAEGNDLYGRLPDIQNAANLEWPADDPTNVAVRAKFLLGVFPYGRLREIKLKKLIKSGNAANEHAFPANEASQHLDREVCRRFCLGDGTRRQIK